MDPVKAKTNFARICQLLIDKGGDALRAALHVVHPPSTLAAALNANRRTLQRLRYSVIKPPQWQLLFPASGIPDSRQFDITLLTILLRNICGLTSPAAGWNVMPPANDTSISANILRIKMYRNEVYGHISSAQYDDTTFKTLWQEISKPLIKLLVLREDIDELKVVPLSLEEEIYIEKLKEWKEQEDVLLEKMNDLERKFDNMTSEFMKLRDTVSTFNPSKVEQLAKFDFTGKIDSLCKKFQDGTRGWFFDKLSSWFTDAESRVMILTAGPGVGKSVLSAKACELYKQRGQLAANHFCDFRNSDYSNPSGILQSLASQMCHNVDGFRDKLTETLRREHSRDSLSDAFRVLLKDPLHALGRREPMLIVVDALDESKTDVKSEFLELISDEFPELPKWIKILISSRPELQVQNKLEHFNPFEIRPKNEDHRLDLENFIRCSVPNLNEDNVIWLVSKCEGSFLYAYYLATELKGMHLGIESKLTDYVRKGMAGFYEKQFKRLKSGLQRFKPGILTSFVNVVAASRAPLPIKIILTCMDVSDEEYEVRKAIVDIMSEILPVYDGWLTVYHKSLWDWLILNGYQEHAFVADVADGTKRLWDVCKRIYRDIDSLRSVSDFRFSPEKMYALQNGGGYLVYVGDTEDFQWLVHVRLNALKFLFCGDLNIDFCRILRIYKSKLTDHLYWSIIQLHSISKIISRLHTSIEASCCVYLQYIANGHFDFVKNSSSCKNTGRDILDEANEIWIEQVTNIHNSNYKMISNAVFPVQLNDSACSPDKKLLACLHGQAIQVFELPSLKMIFELDISGASMFYRVITFSPDSSYFLCNSVRSCVSIREQKEVALIPRGPERVLSCSFSLCGMKLVTSESNYIKVWDVRKKVLLVEIDTQFVIYRCLFSSCNGYVLGFGSIRYDILTIWDLTTLEGLGFNYICSDTCLTFRDSFQIISPPSYFSIVVDTFRNHHFHWPTGEIVLIVSDRCCPIPFTWKNRKCVISSNSSSALVVYDFINQEIVHRFHLDCLPSGTPIHCISKLDETNVLVSYNLNHVILLSFETSAESPVASFITNATAKCCTISPDNLYVACCYNNRMLTIRSVDNGKTLQTVVLQQPPEACWWSEFNLWVVCKGVVVKFPYDSTHTKVLGNGLEECTINFESVLKFVEGVLVIRLNNEGEVSILRICNGKSYCQQIPDSISAVSSVAISSDGCAVLLYRMSFSDYQLLEVACENRYETLSSGILHNPDNIKTNWFCLTGAKNSRNSIWLTYYSDELAPNVWLSSIDFSNDTLYDHLLSIQLSEVKEVLNLSPDYLMIFQDVWMHFINVSNGKIIATLYLGEMIGRLKEDVSIFYLSSKGVLLLVLQNDMKYFKIHNIDKLP